MCCIFDLQNWVGFCACSNMLMLKLIELTDSTDLHRNSTDVESYLWVGKCKDRMCCIFDLQNWVGFCACSNMSMLKLIELTDSTDLHRNSTDFGCNNRMVNAKIECVAYSIFMSRWLLRLIEYVISSINWRHTDSTDLHRNSTDVECYLWVVNAKIECVAYSIVKLSWRLRLFEIKQLSDKF